MPNREPVKPVFIVSDPTPWLGDFNAPMSQDTAIRIGQRLAALRKERGLTQNELAEALAIKQSMVSDYERGALRLHGELILQIVQFFDVTADELLGLTEDRPATASPPPRVTRNKLLLNRLQKILDLPKRDRDALMRTIDAFLAKAS